MPHYKPLFEIGKTARIQSLEALKAFRDTWKFHHPLEEEQLAFAERSGTITWIGTYHGGDLLYTIEGFPGIWHEQCLTTDA